MIPGCDRGLTRFILKEIAPSPVKSPLPTLLLATALILLMVLVGSSQRVVAPLNFTIDYSDPANDVMVLYSNNNTPVMTAGSFTFTTAHPEVDIKWIRTRDNGTSVKIHFETKGNIVNLPNTTYSVNLYTDATNRTHYIVNYTNGHLWLYTNATGSTPRDITGNATITSSCVFSTGLPNIICINLSKSLLTTLTAWNVDGTAVMRGNPGLGQKYTYQDFGWQVPGNPGSMPTVIQGHVFKAGTSLPLAGTNVSTDIGGHWTLTGAAGAYVLNVPPGTYNVTASLKGYYPQTKVATLVQGQGLILDFALNPKPTLIRGHVYIAGTTTGIAGVNVSSDHGGFWILTDATGSYSLNVTPGTYNVTASGQGYYPETKAVSLTLGDAMTQDYALSPVPLYQTPMGLLAIVGGVVAAGLLLFFLLLMRRRKKGEPHLPPAEGRVGQGGLRGGPGA